MFLYPSLRNKIILLGKTSSPAEEYKHKIHKMIDQDISLLPSPKIAKGNNAQNIEPNAEYVKS